MINILLTGGNGQLATCIKDLENKYDDLNFIYTDYLELDICDLDKVKAFFETNKQIDYCVNCAAYTAVDKAESDIEKAFEINEIGPKNLALTCNEYGVTLIHVSTDFVFDGEKKNPYLETDATKPISVYGQSKLKGEIGIQQTIKEYFIIRTAWLYSEHGNNFVKTMLRLGKEREEISVISDQTGTPTYARDLANIILEILRIKSKSYGIYHFSNDGVASWYDFSKAIFDYSGLAIKVIPINTEAYPTPAKRPSYSVMDKTKIKENLGVELYNWRDSLKQCLTKINSND